MSTSAFLHITNGDSVVDGFREARLEGDYLSWIDLMFEGPVNAAALDELAPIRARFFADAGADGYEAALARVRARDDMLRSFPTYGEIVLWFEHDLTDQLQLIQLLSWFAEQDGRRVPLSLINIDTHPDVTRFYGLGQLSGGQLADLLPSRKPVSETQLSLGREAWAAFCAPEPRALVHLLTSDLPALPFLDSALRRFLQEYPSARNGLSRTEEQILVAAAAGKHTRREIFQVSQDAEEAPFMGDWSVYERLDRLAGDPASAVDRPVLDRYLITDHGRSLIAQTADRIRSLGAIDRWLGGVHLLGADAAWRWDERSRTLASS